MSLTTPRSPIRLGVLVRLLKYVQTRIACINRKQMLRAYFVMGVIIVHVGMTYVCMSQYCKEIQSATYLVCQ